MKDETFIDKVKMYFGYLESEYGFRLTREINSEVRPQTDGAVEYTSNTTVVLIDSETGYVTVRFYRAKDGEKYYLTPVDVYEYLKTSDEEKALLLSADLKDQTTASALFNETFLLNQPGWKGSDGTVLDLEKELGNFSNWLQEYATLCIIGDFSKWPDLYEYKIYRARADHLRRGKDELGYSRIKDESGNWKLIKQSIFKDKLEHIERLKKEFPS